MRTHLLAAALWPSPSLWRAPPAWPHSGIAAAPARPRSCIAARAEDAAVQLEPQAEPTLPRGTVVLLGGARAVRRRLASIKGSSAMACHEYFLPLRSLRKSIG